MIFDMPGASSGAAASRLVCGYVVLDILLT